MSKTLITFVLDRSGSMNSILDSTLEAFNAYLGGLQDDLRTNGGDPVDFTLIQFDSQSIDKIYFEKPILEVPALTKETFRPRGGTPLLDAVATTISALETAIANKAEKPSKVIVCVQTDGEENASHEISWDGLKALISRKQEDGWQFNFMGAGIDAYQQGARMGFSQASTMSYDAQDLASTRSAFTASAQNASLYRRGMAADTTYSVMQKQAAGDVYDPTLNPSQGQKAGPVAPVGIGHVDPRFVGTIAHVNHGKTNLTSAVLRAGLDLTSDEEAKKKEAKLTL